MLAKRLPTILPQLTAENRSKPPASTVRWDRCRAASRCWPGVRSIPTPYDQQRGLVGGGNPPAPGESRWHNGVLFLDELPEFDRRTLEVMRQPLEDRVVTISRALRSTTFPANFMLVAALNPCPCGFRGDSRRHCTCNSVQIERYMSRISGPLLDRIDIHIEVPAVPFEQLSSMQEGTSSHDTRQMVERARLWQQQRFSDSTTIYNAKMSSRQVRQYCRLDAPCRSLLRDCCNELGLSARAHDKILRVSRTIADLDACPEIQAVHLQEAINYRMLDRNLLS